MKENTHSNVAYFLWFITRRFRLGDLANFSEGRGSQIYSCLNRAVIAKKEIRCVIFFYVLQCSVALATARIWQPDGYTH